MGRSQALEKLPLRYRLALQLRDEGATPRAIAEVLGVEVESIGLLLEIGAEKLAVIEAEG